MSAFEEWMNKLDPNWRNILREHKGSGIEPDLKEYFDSYRDCWNAALTRAAEVCRETETRDQSMRHELSENACYNAGCANCARAIEKERDNP